MSLFGRGVVHVSNLDEDGTNFLKKVENYTKVGLIHVREGNWCQKVVVIKQKWYGKDVCFCLKIIIWVAMAKGPLPLICKYSGFTVSSSVMALSLSLYMEREGPFLLMLRDTERARTGPFRSLLRRVSTSDGRLYLLTGLPSSLLPVRIWGKSFLCCDSSNRTRQQQGRGSREE